MNTWRWIDSGPLDGAAQMAQDQALLEYSGITGSPVFRVYQWDPCCISLGYHQKVESIDLKLCRQQGIDVARRPTGGRAVFHARELTYSVVIPKQSSWYRSSLSEVYRFINEGLVLGLQKLDVPVRLQKRQLDIASHYKNDVSVSCFSAAARHEILLNGKKLAGSAQRHLTRGVLQHGSILTGPDHLALPCFLAGLSETKKESLRQQIASKTITLSEYLERSVSYKEVVSVLRKGMAESLQIRFQDSRLNPEEVCRMEALRSEFEILSNKENKRKSKSEIRNPEQI